MNSCTMAVQRQAGPEERLVPAAHHASESPNYSDLRLRRERNRWFVDSLLEGDGFEPSVPGESGFGLPVRDRRLASSSLQRRVGRTSNPAFAIHDRPYVRGRPPWFRSEESAHMPEGLRKAGWEGTWSIRIQERQPTAGFWLCVQVGISACRAVVPELLKAADSAGSKSAQLP